VVKVLKPQTRHICVLPIDPSIVEPIYELIERNLPGYCSCLIKGFAEGDLLIVIIGLCYQFLSFQKLHITLSGISKSLDIISCVSQKNWEFKGVAA
jgi:hypothetical protein